MNHNIYFSKDRCYFNGFNIINDYNITTGKSGISYYRCNLIGFILQKLGFAYSLNYNINNKQCRIYINKKSFDKWKVRHLNDDHIKKANFDKLKFSRDCIYALEVICKNNPLTVLTLHEIIILAKKEFSSDLRKTQIIKRISMRLREEHYQSYIENANPPKFVFSWEDTLWGPNSEILSAEEKYVITMTTRFISRLPGILKHYTK